MEIQHYLYAIRRRLWIPVVLPLAAALVTSVFIYIQPERYQATATVVVPSLSNKGYSTSAVTQYFATYKDVLVSDQVLIPVEKATGEKRSDLVAGLSASTATASSNIINVTYTGRNKKDVQDVARYAAVAALDALTAPQLAAAQSEVDRSQSALDRAIGTLNNFTSGPKGTGRLFPEDDYKLLTQEIYQQNNLLGLASLNHETGHVAAYTKVLAQYEQELTALSVEVVQWQSLDQDVLSAQAEHDRAVIDLNAAQSLMNSNHDASAVSVRFLGHVSRIPDVAKYAGVALGVALLLSIAYLVFMEFLHPTAPAPVAASSAGSGFDLRRILAPVGVRAKVGAAAAKAGTATGAQASADAPHSSNGEL